MNAYETFALGQEMNSLGATETLVLEEADVIVLNTCSVTARADQKSRQHTSSFRRRNPNAVLLVMGCYSQTHAQECLDLGADIVLGSSKRKLGVSYIERFLLDKEKVIDVKPSVRSEEYEELGFSAYCDNARVYLKIQDGCDNFCSYCFIPRLRGNSRSRAPREVIEEASAMVKRGFKEVIITGIHIGAYGKDFKGQEFRLPDLLEAMINKIPDLRRLRISSIEESEIDERFLSLLRRFPTIVDHLHIPLQSGSSEVLKAMHRRYDTEAFLAKLEAIRAIRPDIAITTDIIAGFPTETEENHAETLAFCRKARFAEIHVFPFSPRPGTVAATMKDLDPKIKKARVADLLELSKKLREEYKQKFYGKEMEILFEDYDEKAKIAYGHTENYLKVGVESDHPRHGEMANVIYSPSIASD